MLKLEIRYGDPTKKLYTFKIPRPVLDKLYKLQETEPGIGILVTDPKAVCKTAFAAFLLWRKEEEEEY
ncbi:hypothetical protein ES703_110454 [subsurface metagenome]